MFVGEHKVLTVYVTVEELQSLLEEAKKLEVKLVTGKVQVGDDLTFHKSLNGNVQVNFVLKQDWTMLNSSNPIVSL